MATAEVIELHNKQVMTVEECLQLCLRQHAAYADVLVLAWNKDGELVHHSSDMSKGDVNWLLDSAKQDILLGVTNLTIDEEDLGA